MLDDVARPGDDINPVVIEVEDADAGNVVGVATESETVGTAASRRTEDRDLSRAVVGGVCETVDPDVVARERGERRDQAGEDAGKDESGKQTSIRGDGS